MAYSQKDPQWAEKELGNSGLKMKNFGCLVTDVAQALTLAGWNITPGELVDKLNQVGGFDSDGLLQWLKVSEVYPQFHFDQLTTGLLNCIFVKGSWGVYKHWVLQVSGTYYEPFYGVEGLPNNFDIISTNRCASIDIFVAPKPEPTPEPKPEVISVEPTPQPEQPVEPQIAEYVVQRGDNLTNICAKHYGLDKPSGDAYRKALEIAKYNGIANANLIFSGQIIKLP